MTEPVFVAESARLLIAAGTGIILLLTSYHLNLRSIRFYHC